MKNILEILTLISFMSLFSAQASSGLNISSSFPESSSNETKTAAEKYFRNLLKKVNNGDSGEDNESKIIRTESEFKAAYCSLYNKINETDGFLDKRDKRIISEMRKLNMKLMKIEDKLGTLEKNIEEMIRLEVRAMKEELMRSVGNVTVR